MIITQPYQNFIQPDAGGNVKPVSNGKVYAGKEGLDPKLGGNPIYYLDNEGKEVEISNPIYLNATGIIVEGPNSSKSINPYTKEPLSILIENKNGDEIYSNLFFESYFASKGDVSKAKEEAITEAVKQSSDYTDDAVLQSQSQVRKQFQFSSSRNFDNHLFVEITTDNTNKFFYAPTTEVLPSGRIITVYTQKNGKLIDPGQDNTPMQLNVSISDDEGKTYLERVAINKGAGYATSESVIKLNPNDGLIYIFYTSFKGMTGWGHSQKGNDENTSAQIEYITSEDGLSWSQPVNITAKVKPADAYFASIAPTKIGFVGKHLAVPMYYLLEQQGDIVETYITDISGDWAIGEVVRTEKQTDTIGLSGGEIGFFNYGSGELAAIERAYYDNYSFGYRTAIQKLIRKKDGVWSVEGQFETSNCQSSFLHVGPADGFDTDKLFVCAPIGDTGTFNGRKNGRVFDCTNDFSNPVDLGSLMLSTNLAYEYSTIALLASGTFLTSWHGQQYKIHSHGWTFNKFAQAKALKAPCHGMKSLPNLNERDEYDTYEGERVYYQGNDFEYLYINSNFENASKLRSTVVSSAITTINADNFDMVYFQTLSNFTIEDITNGYEGQVVKCLSLSGGTEIEYVRSVPGVGANRIKYPDSGSFTKLKQVGDDSDNGGIISFTKTPYGWFADKPANSN